MVIVAAGPLSFVVRRGTPVQRYKFSGGESEVRFYHRGILVLLALSTPFFSGGCVAHLTSSPGSSKDMWALVAFPIFFACLGAIVAMKTDDKERRDTALAIAGFATLLVFLVAG